MKKKILLLALMLGFFSSAQTLDYDDGSGFKEIRNEEAIKSTVITTKSLSLSIRLNSTIEFATIVNDSKKNPIKGIGGRKKAGTALASSITVTSKPQGSYSCGIPVTAGNFITANINIISPGYYTVVTDVKNGIMFYATGYADKMGGLAIKLQAIGTPFKADTNVVFKLDFGGVTQVVPAIDFVGSPVTQASASGPTISVEGTYIAGIELGTENIINITVTASGAGNYWFSTPVVNGIFFYGSEKFDGAGQKKITLKGYGVPFTDSTDNLLISGVSNLGNVPVISSAAPIDSFIYNIEKDVYKVVFKEPGTSNEYTIQITGRKEKTEKKKILTGTDKALSIYEEFIYEYYGPDNLKITPYGILMNKGITDVAYPSDVNVMNTVHIFLDEKGNSLLTTIPQGLPDIQYVVHVIFKPASEGSNITYGVMDFSSHKGGVRIENDQTDLGDKQSTKPGNMNMRDYSIILKTADSNIDFTVVRYEDGDPVDSYRYKINMTDSFTAGMSVGLLNTQLQNPNYILMADPLNSSVNVVKMEEGGNRGFATVFATLYTSPITLFKYYRDKKRIKKGSKELTDINNPVADFQLYSKDYLYMRPVWERIYPTIGVGITEKIFQNLFFGLNWEFARGGSLFAGGHYGRVNVFNVPDDFKFESTNISASQYDLYKNTDWNVGWSIGASLDFRIIENLFK